eukprot:1881929-Pleurochrysis_carterae.AAC.1
MALWVMTLNEACRFRTAQTKLGGGALVGERLDAVLSLQERLLLAASGVEAGRSASLVRTVVVICRQGLKRTNDRVCLGACSIPKPGGSRERRNADEARRPEATR